MDISSLINQACFLLSQGKLVIMPTETVYGLAADATHDLAVASIYKLKNRPTFNPLIVHVGCIDQAEAQAFFSEKAFLLARHFWGQKGGPLTLVLKRKNPHLSHLVTAGLDTVAVRMPSHPMALDLLKTYPNPLAAPSANRSEALSPTSFQAVQESFGDDTPFGLDGGPCQVGLESTILDLSGSTPILLRPGGISVEQIEYVLGQKIEIYKGSTIQAPGMTKRHYAPKTPLRLNATNKKNDEAFLAFGPGTEDFETLNLSPQGDDVEAASHLFAMLRELDHQRVSSIAVAPIPTSGLGLAINDRLQRAAFNETKG